MARAVTKTLREGVAASPLRRRAGQGFDAALCGRLGRLPLSEVRLQLLQELWASLQSHHAHPSPSEFSLIGDLVSRLGVGREETAAARHQMAAGSGKSVAAPRTGRAPPEGPGREPDGSHGSCTAARTAAVMATFAEPRRSPPRPRQLRAFPRR